MAETAGSWDPQVWGCKAPASSHSWLDAEVSSSDIAVCTMMRLPKVDNTMLKALLIEGRCFYAGIPLFSFVSTSDNADSKYWSLVTFTYHASTGAFAEWVAKFQADDAYAVTMGGSMFPASMPKKIRKLGKFLSRFPGRPSTDFRRAPTEALAPEQLLVEEELDKAPVWAKASAGFYAVNLVEYDNCGLKALKNRLYGLRMLGHFAVCQGSCGPVSGYPGREVLLKSQRVSFLPANVGAVKYDWETGRQMFVSDFFTKWFPWKHLKNTEGMATIALDAECSQWGQEQ